MIDLKAMISRRNFVGTISLMAGAAGCGMPGFAIAQSPGRRETADLITGPFYPRLKPADRDADMTLVRGHRGRAAGQVVHLSGRVINLKGEPLRHAAIEIWQANAHGRYDHPSDTNLKQPLDPNFHGYALLRTDRDGRYALTTVKPGAYPTPRGDMRAPHIHFQVDGVVDRKVTQLFFPGEPLNEQDRHLNSVRRPETLVANVTSTPGASEITAVWDIVLTRG